MRAGRATAMAGAQAIGPRHPPSGQMHGKNNRQWRGANRRRQLWAAAEMHWKGNDRKGDPRGGYTGGWRRLPERLGAVTVGYKCH